MATKFKKGDKVRQVMSKPIEGTVIGMAVDEEGGNVNVHVGWKAADGHLHGVYLTEDQLEAVPTEEPTHVEATAVDGAQASGG